VTNRFVDPETRKKLKGIKLKNRRDKQKRMFRTEDDIDPRFPDDEEKLDSKKSKRKKIQEELLVVKGLGRLNQN